MPAASSSALSVGAEAATPPRTDGGDDVENSLHARAGLTLRSTLMRSGIDGYVGAQRTMQKSAGQPTATPAGRAASVRAGTSPAVCGLQQNAGLVKVLSRLVSTIPPPDGRFIQQKRAAQTFLQPAAMAPSQAKQTERFPIGWATGIAPGKGCREMVAPHRRPRAPSPPACLDLSSSGRFRSHRESSRAQGFPLGTGI